MEHHVLHVHGADKHATTIEIGAREDSVLMFLDTKHAVDRLTRDLLHRGVRAAALHGGKMPELLGTWPTPSHHPDVAARFAGPHHDNHNMRHGRVGSHGLHASPAPASDPDVSSAGRRRASNEK